MDQQIFVLKTAARIADSKLTRRIHGADHRQINLATVVVPAQHHIELAADGIVSLIG